MNLKKLQKFIWDASKATYAAGDSSIKKKEKDGSTTIEFSKGDWHFHDNYFGGEPYGGREVVYYKGRQVWIMVYYGWVEKGYSNDDIYETLTGALSASKLEEPYRGPREYTNGNSKYVNNLDGSVESFSGEESIEVDGKIAYRAKYMGGLVDLKE